MHSPPVSRDLVPDDLQIPSSPQIRGLNIVMRIGIEPFVRRYKFIELMNDQKDGSELGRIAHE